MVYHLEEVTTYEVICYDIEGKETRTTHEHEDAAVLFYDNAVKFCEYRTVMMRKTTIKVIRTYERA